MNFFVKISIYSNLSYRDTCMQETVIQIFIAVLCIIAKDWKQMLVNQGTLKQLMVHFCNEMIAIKSLFKSPDKK